MGTKIKSVLKKIRLKRTTVLALVFIFMSCILIRQLFNLQIIQGEDYINKFQSRTTKTRVLKSTRGKILDRNGEVLATNVLSYSITFEDNGSYNSTREKNLTLNGIAYRVLQILEKSGMQAFTPHTITDPNRFVEGLAAVRRQGYAVEDGEYRIGLRSAAAPVYNRDGQVRYALGVAGLFRRVQAEDFQNAIAHLVHQARQLSMALGWREEKEL